MENTSPTLIKNEEEAIELQSYGKSKSPDVQKIRAEILAILNRKVKEELPFAGVPDLRRRVCCKVKAPGFFKLLKSMEKDELLMVSGVDSRWAQCAVWDHPRLIEWRKQLAKWDEERAERDKRDAEERRQWEIENAPRIARERFQKELGEFFVDNSDELFEVVQRIFAAHAPKKTAWLRSRTWL
jgi:hypothetical protein